MIRKRAHWRRQRRRTVSLRPEIYALLVRLGKPTPTIEALIVARAEAEGIAPVSRSVAIAEHPKERNAGPISPGIWTF